MRWVRFGGAAAVLLAVLGCSGMVPSGGIQTGADAVVPTGFPMPPPPGGTLDTSGDVTLLGMRTMTVQYSLGSESDQQILDLYEQAMKGAGFVNAVRTDTPDAANVTATSADNKSVWTASIGKESGRRVLTLVAISR